MRKFTFILSLLVAFATTALAQGTILSSSELNALTSSKKVAVKNLSGTNNRWLALTSSVEELTPEALLVVEPISDGTFYLKRASEADSYVQAAASGTITLGAQATAQVFTAATPSAPGNETLADGSDLDKLVRFVQNGASTWLNCQTAAGAPVLGNTGQGGWTMHNVYDMSNYYVLTINEVVDGVTTVVKKVVEAGAAINVDKDGYTHDYAASTMPAADTEITVNYTVDGGAETPEPTYLVNISTEENRKYYKIGSYNRGGYLSTVGDGAAVQHVAETNASYWYFIAAGNDGGVYFRNYATEQYLGADMTMSATPAVWYIIENGVNTEGYSISKASTVGSGCIDANSYNTGVGTWNPSANDWHGTTWVFVEVEDPAAAEAALEAAKAELTATAANATAILTAANLSVTATPVTLAEGNLSSNAVELNEGNIAHLVDGITGDANNFFHTNWSSNGASDDDMDHYLLVDLGDGNSITNLQFNYHTRTGAAADFPVDIVVAGSNNGTEFTDITTIKDIPVVTANASYTSPAIINATAYRYIRLMVTKTSTDRVGQGAAHNYWHMAEFGLSNANISVADEYKDAVNEVVALDAAMKSVTSLDGMTLAEVNAANTALIALVDAVEAVVETPETPDATIIGKLVASVADAWDWTSSVTWTTPAEGTYEALITACTGKDIDVAGEFDPAYVVSTEQLLQVTDMGDITVAFKWTGGNHRIDVLGVDLLDSYNNVVYSNYSVGFSGGAGIPVEYKMEDVETGTYTLRYFSTSQGNNNSKGTITITYTEAVDEPDETIISNLADANPNKAYTATTQRASWAVDTEGTVIGTTSELNAEDLNHQFAFIKGSDDNYYLWSVGAQKFVTPSAALSATLCKPIQFNDGSSVEAGRVVVQFADNANGYFNINGEKNLVIDSWSTADAGNAVKFVEVADFNPATAEAALEAYLTTGVYKEELNAVIAELDVIVAGVGTQIGYYTSSDADYASKLAAIKEFAAAMDGKTAEEIQTQTAAAEALKATFSLILPTAGNYYFIKNNTNVWTSDLAVYANGSAPAWKAFSEDDVNFWWTAETVDGGIAFKNVATGTYIAGNVNQSVAWTLSETATAIEFANMGAAANGNAIMSLTLGHMMHANGHGGGSNSAGNIVGWDAAGSSTASGWELVEGDGTKLADLYRSTVEAAITELNSMKSLLGDSYSSYSCNEELKAQVEAFDVAAATYEELVAMYAVIGQLRASFKINTPEVGVSYVRIKAGVAGWNDDNPYLGSANSTAKDGRAEFIATADANSIFFYCEDKCLVSYASGQHLVNNGNFLGYNSDLTVAGAAVSFGSAETFGRYSISFIGNNESARALYIHQSDYTDAATPGATGDGYTFALEAVTSLPVTVTSAGYATFYAPVAVTIPTGVKAFYATAINGDYVSLVEVTGTIPANTGVILKAEAATYSFVIAEDVDAIENNLLDGTIAKEVLTKEGTGNYYVLGVVDGVVGMYNPVKGEDNTTFINAGHKAYMYVEGAASSAGYRFDFSGTTGISEIETENAADAVIYDLTGRRVNDTNRPGIYIVNGKKILVK